MDETVRTERQRSDEVVASQGLWTDVPDLDAVRILMDGDVVTTARVPKQFERQEVRRAL